MKHTNLQILKDNNINVPSFIIVSNSENIDLSFSNSKKFAVRSSFEVEDGDSSFAGQFETILNVEKENISEAVNKVINSFNNESVNIYKNNRNIHNISKGFAIIQEMIDSELSGVIFTANPQGILNETVIVVGKGLGNNVVEDKIDTTSYFYNQDDDIYYFEQNNNSPILPEELLKELLKIAARIKTIFDKDMDIEFGIRNNQIYILQARPITTLNNENVIILDNSNIVESYPGISLPLTQSFVKEIYRDIFKNCIRRLSKNDELVNNMENIFENMVDIANGRVYYRISNWYSVLALLPFSRKIIPIWQKMMGVNNKYVQNQNNKVSLRTKLKITSGFFYFLNKTPNLMHKLNNNFENNFNNFKVKVSEANNIEILLNTYKEIKDSILLDWDITLINDMYSFIYTYLAGDENKKCISDIKNLESMKPVIEINKLAALAKNYGIDSEEYNIAAQNYIEKYGDRCLAELKLETKTYRTNPELLTQHIKQKLNWPDSKINNKINELPIKNKFIKNAKTGIKNREISRMNRSRIFGLIRTLFLKIGNLLKESDKIENIDDIFYLRINEITLPNLKDLVEKRKEEYQEQLNIPAYSRLVFENKIVNKRINNSTNNILNKSNILKGTPASEGIITGEVLVIDNPNIEINSKNKILVTKTTDPGWVFLIENAAGIIAEKGSLLSHTAIITRELHKPSIVNVKDCTKILKNGDIIEMNAIDGIITIKERIKT